MSGLSKAVRHRAEYLAVRALLASLAWLPRGRAQALARSYTAVLDKLVPRLRRVAHRNLEFALPELPADQRDSLIDGVYANLARILVAVAHQPAIDKHNVHDWIRYEGFEHFTAAKAQGRGVLFATAHLGNWELSAFAHALLCEPMYVVVRPLDNPLLDRFLTERRSLSGNTILGKKDATRAIFKALKQQDAVGILIDHNTLLDEGVFVDFFGVPASTQPVFSKLAARTDAVVIPGFALWSEAEQKCILKFYPPLPMTGDLQADTQRIQSHLESVIREYPDQWLWLHRRWKTRPEGEPPLY